MSDEMKFGKKQPWPDLGDIPAFPGGDEENHEKPEPR
jgi:hypothetical protein